MQHPVKKLRHTLAGKITRKRLKKFLSRHASSERTLDIGCSEASYASLFPNRIGLDIDAEKAGVDVVGDAHALPFQESEFDVVLCTEVLEHLHTPQNAIDEMFRVLKSGGKLILTTRFLYPLHDVPHDYFRYTKYGLRHLLRNWEIDELESETDTMETFAVLLQTVASKSQFRGGFLMRVAFLIDAWLYQQNSWLIREESGGSRARPVLEQNLMASGYYVVARKPNG